MNDLRTVRSTRLCLVRSGLGANKSVSWGQSSDCVLAHRFSTPGFLLLSIRNVRECYFLRNANRYSQDVPDSS